MTDIQIEFDALRTARVRVDDALSTFESATRSRRSSRRARSAATWPD